VKKITRPATRHRKETSSTSSSMVNGHPLQVHQLYGLTRFSACRSTHPLP